MASSSSSKRKREMEDLSSKICDVFINHRGPDVKSTLASGLYQFLNHLGLEIFLDSPELQLGDTLSANVEHAIRSSSVHIAILSRRYAESSWCLAELQLMLQTRAKIIPVFYEVNPSDLRHIEKGVYAKAFLRFEEKGRYIDKLEQWKLALHKVSDISGIKFDGDLGNLFKRIMDIVLKEVREARNKYKSEVADHPVGLEEAIQELEVKTSTIGQSNNGNGKIVAIVGRAGVGKTTLAKAFYNHTYHMFYRASFLFDVGGAHRNKKMRKMQQKLMDDLSMHLPVSSANFPPSGPSEGFGVEIKSKLEQWYSKPLIILDGVDHADQLEVLEVKEFLSHGALVIVTCRDKTILQSFEMVKIYEMRGLDPMYARELFCWYAFHQSHPPKGREKLVEDTLIALGGLPLNLKKLGQHIYSIQNGTDAEV